MNSIIGRFYLFSFSWHSINAIVMIEYKNNKIIFKIFLFLSYEMKFPGARCYTGLCDCFPNIHSFI